jgi:hypothetical protein
MVGVHTVTDSNNIMTIKLSLGLQLAAKIAVQVALWSVQVLLIGKLAGLF